MIMTQRPATMLAATVEESLNAGGTVMMVLSLALVLGLFAFCMVRILTVKTPPERYHAPLDINTQDTE